VAEPRVRINPNLRLGRYLTMVDLDEDVAGELPATGPCEVRVYESVSGLTGRGYLVEVDPVGRTATLSVDWAALKLGTHG